MGDRKPNADYDVLMKVVVIGDSGVGKTNLLSRFIRNEFKLESKSTIGVEFSTKYLQMEGKRVKAQLWDTAGEEKFRAVAKQYYRNASAALLVYDTTNAATLDHCERWLQECRAYADPNIQVTLVGNKIDLRHLQAVSQKQARDFAANQNIKFVETSALANTNVEMAFLQVLNDGFQVMKASGQLEKVPGVGSENFHVSDTQPDAAKAWSCCWK